jgi:hypothetical protein
MTYGRWTQGFYQLRNKEKYIGNNKPFYRSSYELRVMNFFDLTENILAWSSERHIIPYKLPKEIDRTGKIRRYFVDFYCEVRQKDGNIKKFLVEVKPLIQSIKPENPKKITKSYKNKIITYLINKIKWEAAQQYCKFKGYEWKILTEAEIFNIKT